MLSVRNQFFDLTHHGVFFFESVDIWLFRVLIHRIFLESMSIFMEQESLWACTNLSIRPSTVILLLVTKMFVFLLKLVQPTTASIVSCPNHTQTPALRGILRALVGFCVLNMFLLGTLRETKSCQNSIFWKAVKGMTAAIALSFHGKFSVQRLKMFLVSAANLNSGVQRNILCSRPEITKLHGKVRRAQDPGKQPRSITVIY